MCGTCSVIELMIANNVERKYVFKDILLLMFKKVSFSFAYEFCLRKSENLTNFLKYRVMIPFDSGENFLLWYGLEEKGRDTIY
jgi:hypothetical protein